MIILEYERIPLILKRFSFEAKMEEAQHHSNKIMSPSGLIDPTLLRGKWLPWELNTYALFSIFTINEYNNQNFLNTYGKKRFSEIMTSVRGSQHGGKTNSQSSSNFLRDFLIVVGLTQFILQENKYMKYYRYSYFFNFSNDFVDMKTEFFGKFNQNYEDFVQLSNIVNLFYPEGNSLQSILHDDFHNVIYREFSQVIKFLELNRQEFIDLQRKLINKPEHYVTSYNYLYTYPFILHQEKRYFPLPHTLTEAVTTSLLTRLTAGNNDLRSKFGKYVLESYLTHIVSLGSFFEECIEEYPYNFKRNQKRTVDLMLRKQDLALLIECKSIVPQRGLRNLNEGDIERTILRLSENMIQLYRNATMKFGKEYYPFDEQKTFELSDTFGIVIMLEDSFIHREEIYKKVAQELDLDIDQYNHLCSNFKFISLYELERIIFEDWDLFELLGKNKVNPQAWFDFTLIPVEIRKEGLNTHLKSFIDELNKELTNFVDVLHKEGIIKS